MNTKRTIQPTISPVTYYIEYRETKNGAYCMHDIKLDSFESAQIEREKLLMQGVYDPRIKKHQ